MSLQLWLPMTKDLSDQGLGGCTITNNGATLDNNGKLGKCYNFDGTDDRILVSGLNRPKNITVAFWMKRNVTTNTRQFMFTAWQGITLELTTTNYVHCYTYRGGGICDSTMKITADSGWVHIAYSFEDKVGGKLYINGVLNSTTASTGSIEWNTGSGYIGNFNTYYNGKMNDFRIYDHALSPREIEILSRGLVAHYPLNNNGGGQPNLYDFESVASKWAIDGLTLANATDDVYGNVLKITSPSSVTSQRIYRNVSNVWKANQKFTVSFLAKASKTAVVKMSRSLANYAPDVTVGTTWKRYSTVITCSTTVEGGTLSIQTSTASADLYITQVKLELGDKATAYQPGVGDSHYVPLGYDSTTIYDCSGCQNNATPWAYDSTGSIDITTDTPRYSTSTFINSANPTSGEAAGTRYIYGNCTLVKPEKLTLTFWCKPIKGYGNTTAHGIFSLTNYPIGANAGVDYQEAPFNHRDAAFDVNGISGSTYTHKRLSVTFIANEWHHYAITYDGRYAKLYKDGVQSTSVDMGATMPLGDMKGIVPGFSKAGGVWRHVQAYYSDIRLYVTCLSDTQIAELYNTAVSVANNGTLMGYELVEV